MTYQVKPAVWLKTETDKVEAIILMPAYWGRTYTVQVLIDVMIAVGVTYSTDQMTLIGAELATRGILVSV